MKKRFLVVGGSGLFGKCIAKNLVRCGADLVKISSRNESKASRIAEKIGRKCVGVGLDTGDLTTWGKHLEDVDVVINTAGPWDNAEVAKMVCGQKKHYVDLADSRPFVQGFVDQVDGIAKANGVVALTGASSVPAINTVITKHALKKLKTEEIRSVKTALSGAFATDFGRATISSILEYAGQQFQRREAGKSFAFCGWRDLSFESFRGSPRRRLVAAVNTPDLDLLPSLFGPKLKSVRTYGGVGHYFPTLSLFCFSFLPKLIQDKIRVDVSQRIADFLPFLNRFVPKNGIHNQGMMKVSVLAKDPDTPNTPVIYEWSLTSESGDGIEVPSSPAVLYALGLASNLGQFEVGAHVAGSDSFLTWEKVDQYLQEGKYQIETKENVRRFHSPILEVLGSEKSQRIPNTLLMAHAYGGEFSGSLQVIWPEPWFLKPACIFAGMPPSSNGEMIPVTVTIEPIIRSGVSGSDGIWFRRNINGHAFLSKWVLSNGAIWEQFRFDQHFSLDVRISEGGNGFDLVGRELFLPVPATAYSSSTVDPEKDPQMMNLYVMSKIFGIKFFGYKGKLSIESLWF